MYDVSVIIPVYNAERYIEKCIKSVLDISDIKFEIILINDGSTDGSDRICTMYANNNSNIKYINQDNKGVSATRNIGLKKASGEWIMFIDSDDYLLSGVENIIAKAIKSELDYIVFGYDTIETNNKEIEKFIELSREEMIKELFIGNSIEENVKIDFRSVWAKLYRKSIIEKNDIMFCEDIDLAEDMLFNLRMLESVFKVGCYCNSIYHYTIDNETSLTSVYKSNIIKTKNILFNKLDEMSYYNQYFERYISYYKIDYIIVILKFYLFHNRCAIERKTMKKIFKENIATVQNKQAYKEMKKNGLVKKMPVKKRVLISLAINNCFSLCKTIYKIKYR